MTNDANKKSLSMDEWKAKKKAEREAVFAMIDDTLKEIVEDGEKFKSFLDTQSRSSRYSTANALLLFRQRPGASRVKSFDEWAEEKVNVRKGEKSISILEPVEYTKKDGTNGISYHVKKVFDIRQTDGKQAETSAVETNPGKLTAVMLDAAPVDVSVVEDLPIPDFGAYYDHNCQTLFIQRENPDPIKLFQCVAREMALAQLSVGSEVYNRQELGFPAACTAYMLCKKYGIDGACIAVNRVPEGWKEKEPKEIRAEMNKARTAMSEISGRISDELYKQKQARSKDMER